MVSPCNWYSILLVAQPVCVRFCVRLWSNVITDLTSRCLLGESAVPELHGSSVLLSAPSHLLLSWKSLPHDATGETPTVFHLEVHPPHSILHWTLCPRIIKQKCLLSKMMWSEITKFSWPPWVEAQTCLCSHRDGSLLCSVLGWVEETPWLQLNAVPAP